MAPDVFDDLDVLRTTTPQLTPRAPLGSPVGSAPRKISLGLDGDSRVPTTRLVERVDNSSLT
jgi:hypothetical protein